MTRPSTAIPEPLWKAYSEEFARFAEEAQRDCHSGRCIVFYGSSSIRLWADLKEHFPDLPVVNRGFGGCTVGECAALFDLLVAPLNPRQLILYAGDNDLAGGAGPADVIGHVSNLLRKRNQALGGTRVLLLSIKPSPARAHLLHRIRQTNAGIEQLCREWDNCEYVDVFSRMLNGSGMPKRELFLDDWLHLNRLGYDLWRQILRPRLLG